MSDEKMRLLVVDDDEEDFALTRERLEEVGGMTDNMKWVTTFEAAVESLSPNDYDLCITDYNLRAGKTGLDLVAQMKATSCRTPFIVLTGQGTLGLCIEAGKRGAVDFLDKGSLTPPQLGDAIRRALQGARTAETLRQAGEQLRRMPGAR
jgi:two-component system, cell cycle sensor histidine kinase and response regulator CckA